MPLPGRAGRASRPQQDQAGQSDEDQGGPQEQARLEKHTVNGHFHAIGSAVHKAHGQCLRILKRQDPFFPDGVQGGDALALNLVLFSSPLLPGWVALASQHSGTRLVKLCTGKGLRLVAVPVEEAVGLAHGVEEEKPSLWRRLLPG